MTTTEAPMGIDEGKPSSRVLRPPGGASSFSLGGGPVEERPLRQASSQGTTDKAASAAAQPPSTPDNPPAEGRSQTSSAKAKATSHSRIFGDPEPASPVGGRDLARGASPFNPITGEIYPGFERVVSNLEISRFGRPTSQDATDNPITGGGASQPKPAAQPQSITKVRQPPGGFSHGIF